MTRCLGEVFLILLTLELVVVSSIQGNQQQRNSSEETPDHRGKSFLLGFLEMEGVSTRSEIYVTTRTRGQVSVSFLGRNMTTSTVQPGISTVIHLPSGVRMSGFGKEQKGISITSNVTISVYAMNSRPRSRDVHVVFPSHTLGYEHVAVTFTARRKALIGIVALRDNTLVQIRLRFPPTENVSYEGRTYRSGDVLRVFLNRLETFQVEHRRDLTGTVVISSEPVAVLSGNECASVPSGKTTCSHLALQVPSVSKWGRRFITTPVADRNKGDLFRIVAAYADTHVAIEGKENFTLAAGEHKQFELRSSEYRCIGSSRPSLLVQFNKGSLGDVLSEPFTLLVPHVEQYASSYDLVVVQKEKRRPNFLKFISVVIETSRTQAILFNTSLLKNKQEIFTWVPVAGTQYSASLSRLKETLDYPESFSIQHNETDGRFAVYVVGHTDSDGYGYLAGMTLADINCDRLFVTGFAPKECEGFGDEDLGEYAVSNCNSSAVSFPGGAYLKGARYNDSIAAGNCEATVNRTWYFSSPNGPAIIVVTQRIKWQKPRINVTFPADVRVDCLNGSAVEKLRPNVSSSCPSDNVEITYVDNVSTVNDNTTLVRRLWTVREKCGRTVTGNQNILVNSSTAMEPQGKNQESRKDLRLVIGLSIGFGLLGFLLPAIIALIIWKHHKSKRCQITIRVNVLQAQDHGWNYTNPVAEHSVYTEINIESLNDDTKTAINTEALTQATKTEINTEALTQDIKAEINTEGLTQDTETEINTESLTQDIKTEINTEGLTQDTETEINTESLQH